MWKIDLRFKELKWGDLFNWLYLYYLENLVTDGKLFVN